jgi:Xaa-Pro aminopeptidase
MLPDAAIIIDIATGESIFLLGDFPSDYAYMTGPVPTASDVLSTTGVDRVESLGNLNAVIASFSPSIIYATTAPVTFSHPTIDLHTLLTAAAIARTAKSPKEAAALRRATAVTGECIVEVLKWVHWEPGFTERAIGAYFKMQAICHGCPHLAFLTIAAAGPNACFLHREGGAAPIEKGDLVVLDCGVFYEHYPGDITRTFPISGKFSAEQAFVYSALLKLQKSLIEMVKPDVHWRPIWDHMYAGIWELLQELGVLPAGLPFDEKLHEFFLPHGLSHHIGCNMHDHCQYVVEESKIKDTWRRGFTLGPGHVISIEPGIYFSLPRLARLNREEPPWDKINLARAVELGKSVGGIRIEDDVLVTEDGCEVLSTACPKEIAEIEALMAKPV